MAGGFDDAPRVGGGAEHLVRLLPPGLEGALAFRDEVRALLPGAVHGSEVGLQGVARLLQIFLGFGGEHEGVSRLVREKCDYIVSLPMKGKVTSLNASVAAGVVMFEILRQRSSKK